MSTKDFSTTFLFNKSSFRKGAGSVMSLYGNYYNFNYSKSEDEADYKALLNDFGMIGKDLAKATTLYWLLNNEFLGKLESKKDQSEKSKK